MKRSAPAVLLVAALCACAEQPVRYAPTAAPPQMPAAALPTLLLEDVVDHTNGGRFDFGGAGEMPRMWAPDVDWSETARQAFVSELQRLGWPTTESRVAARARLNVAVEDASAQWATGGFNLPVKGKLTFEVVLKTADGRAVWGTEISGAGRGTIGAGGAPQNGIREAWNAALNAAMPKLERILADERPWEKLGGRAAPAEAALEAAPAPAEPDIDQLPAARAARPKTYAVVIGIEHYREKLPNADFAAGDAKLAARYFERALGVPEANVAVLTDDRATKSDFEKYFERWLPNRVEAGDTVYVYYSGHGAPNPAKGDAYLVPYDADPTYIAETGYPVKRLFDDLAKLPAKQVYVAMDSCFSGAGGRSVIAQGARPLVNVAQADVPANLTVLSASAGDQISNSYREKGHGLFTYFFLKGLKEKGGDIRAAFEYLKPEVARTARREFNADQDPQWRQGR